MNLFSSIKTYIATPIYRVAFQHPFYSAQKAIRARTSSSSVLIFAFVAALVIANIPAISHYYFDLWDYPVVLQIGDFNLFSHGGHPMSLLSFINDALMAIFFFTIGLEIKREVMVGELSSLRQALLPILGAIGGMIAPVLIFMFMSQGTDYSGGAAIPMATDIAFSLGVLAILGSRVPISLKVFLTTLAVVDDIGGIIVIAICYTTEMHAELLLWAAGLLVVMIAGSRAGIQSKAFYITIGVIIWYLFLNSGIHPTIAGVIVAFCIPAKPVYHPYKYIRKIRKAIAKFNREDEKRLKQSTVLSKQELNWLKEIESASDKVISPAQDLEDTLAPFVNYFVVPAFAFANAGIYLLDMSVGDAFQGLSLAIILGLVVGKFVGIFSFSWLAIVSRVAPMPSRSTWKMLAAVSMLGGIGFTVSLFIATLSFPGAANAELLNHAKLGIVVGSLLSGALGLLFLSLVMPKHRAAGAKPQKSRKSQKAAD